MEVISFLDNILGSHRIAQRNEYLWTCPFCSHHKPKLAVNITTSNWHCWVCSTKGRTLFGLLKMMGIKNRYNELAAILDIAPTFRVDETEVETVLVLPREYKPLWKLQPRDLDGRHALAYLKSRGISKTDIMKYRLGYCSSGEYDGRIITPSYDVDGKLNFFTGRTYCDSPLAYRNPQASKNIVGFESLISWDYEILICEGPLDAMSVRRNAIPLFGKTMPMKVRDNILIHGPPAVYFVLDKDAESDALRMAQDFSRQNIKTYVVQLDDDPSSIGFDNVWKAIHSTEELTFNSLIKLRLANLTI